MNHPTSEIIELLTPAEREFMDLYVRAVYMHDYDAYAKRAAKALGITYDHFSRMDPFYLETWKTSGEEWPDAIPPIPENREPPISWPSLKAFEARLDELETGPYSHLTYREMRDYMRQKPLPALTAVMDEAHTTGRLEPDTVQIAITDFRATHPYQ